MITSQEKYQANELKEFDVLASVRRLQHSPFINEQLKKSILDEELSYVAEGINAPHDETYFFFLKDDDLKDINGRSLSRMLSNGVEASSNEFSRSRALADIEEMNHALLLMQGKEGGNVMMTFRPYPEDNELTEETLTSLGFQPKRRLGYIHIYERLDNNRLLCKSISIDGCTTDILRKIALDYGLPIPESISTGDMPAYPLFFSINHKTLREDVVNRFDEYKYQETGIKHCQGRVLSNEKMKEVEIRSFINQQEDLVDCFWRELVSLSKYDKELEINKKRLTYSFWAAIKNRYSGQTGVPPIENGYIYELARQEIYKAGSEAALKLEILAGCGASLNGNKLFDMSSEEAKEEIFSDSDESKLPEKIRCIKCGEMVESKKVVQPKSWRCPHCRYEVDVCTGKEINQKP